MVCGGWLKANAPRIEAYNNVQNYTYADGAAKHVGERSYYDSTLLKKEIIKYGTMTNEGGGVYTFRAAGTAFSNVRQTFIASVNNGVTPDELICSIADVASSMVKRGMSDISLSINFSENQMVISFVRD